MFDSSAISRREAMREMTVAVLTASAAGTLSTPARGDTPKTLPANKLPNDSRLGPLKDLNSYFPFVPSPTPQAWEQRAEYVRRQIKVATGQWLPPTKTKIDAVVHGRVDREGYSVEKVYFESSPGLYVTGSLYRPTGKAGRKPGILCPHGHWRDGRFFDHGPEALKTELSSGAEKFEVGGRYPLQARCVQLARMGCVVFHYDMLGYADSAPLSQALAHGFKEQRPELSRPDHWGLFSAQAELRLLNSMGLQTLNSIRALDWLLTLPDIDTDRIGVTGASGGGTQTFILAAIDPRPAAAFPAVMVSTAMQGGCTCENASYLRVNTGNIEFAALTAPRPLGLSAANDWTKEIETKGLPELKQHYSMLGVPDRVEGRHFEFGHNYNYVSRAMMYEFFNKHLQLGVEGPIVEEDFVPLTKDELSVWDDQHPRPKMDEAAEVAVLQALDRDAHRQLQKLTPHDTASLQEYRRVVGGAVDVMVGRKLPATGEVTHESSESSRLGGYVRHQGPLRLTRHGEETPTIILLPENWNREVVLWIHPAGKAGLFHANGDPIPEIGKLLERGRAVVAIDLFLQGEFLADGKSPVQSRRVENPREFAGYTLGYNHPLFAQRVHDVLTAVSFIKHHETQPTKIHLVGLDGAAHWAAAAGAQCGDIIDSLALGTAGFRFASITDVRDPDLWPGAVKYGDLPGLIALSAPRQLWLGGEGKAAPAIVKAAYESAGASAAMTVHRGTAAKQAPAVVEWLLG